MNSAIHEVTGYSPFFLNFARQVSISGDFYGKVETTDNIFLLPRERTQYVEDLKGLSEIFESVQTNLRKGYQRNKKAYDLRRRDVISELVIRFGEETKFCRTRQLSLRLN